MLHVDVILPLPLHGLYTYSVPAGLDKSVSIGSRVIVQFGKKKFYTAIVYHIYNLDKVDDTIKDITTVLDDFPIITSVQLKLWEWISMYYICSLGDVYKAALPSVLKLESETYVIANPGFEGSDPLKANEQKVYNSLSSTKAYKIAEIAKQSGISNVIPVIKSLVDKGVAYLSEDLNKNYSAKTQSAIRFARQYSETRLHELLDELARAKKQEHLLLTFIDLSQTYSPVWKKQLLQEAGVSDGVLTGLTQKGILEVYDYEVNRVDYGTGNLDATYALNSHQQKAYEEVKESFKAKDITLLYGVTSSGKTEIYIQLIKDAIARGKQVLYLLPEIALTTQITNRLKKVFGDKMAVYHSKFNDNERAEIWNKQLKGEYSLILGARSAVFLPFNDLGLIIVDEEHEGSYKQQDPAPRYNARNVAMVLADMYGAKTLLGTATPSVETYQNARTGRYGLVTLNKRHDDIKLPDIEVVNVKELRRRKQMKSILSPPLIDKMATAFSQDEQVILFQNRRGFASMLECKTCSWVPRCTHCDVSLTYHKGQQVMACHYCGAIYSVPAVCPECDTPTLEILGYGTERVEEEVLAQFPEALTARMDLDTTRTKRAYERIIGNFEAGKTNVLIGTQMVSKGLDFDNVSIVGIINADNMLNYPDFRAHERAFQLMMQVSGRAGRKNKQGLVILQTSHPGHPVIQYVKNNDYESFFNLQIEERKIFRYPPFYRLISIVLRAKDEVVLDAASRQFYQSLRQSFAERVYVPVKPPVSRVQSLYIRKILLKLESRIPVQKVREALSRHQAQIFADPRYRSVLVHYDVDPV